MIGFCDFMNIYFANLNSKLKFVLKFWSSFGSLWNLIRNINKTTLTKISKSKEKNQIAQIHNVCCLHFHVYIYRKLIIQMNTEQIAIKSYLNSRPYNFYVVSWFVPRFLSIIFSFLEPVHYLSRFIHFACIHLNGLFNFIHSHLFLFFFIRIHRPYVERWENLLRFLF